METGHKGLFSSQLIHYSWICICASYTHITMFTSLLQKCTVKKRLFMSSSVCCHQHLSVSAISACFDMIKYSTVLPKPDISKIFITIWGKSANLWTFSLLRLLEMNRRHLDFLCKSCSRGKSRKKIILLPSWTSQVRQQEKKENQIWPRFTGMNKPLLNLAVKLSSDWNVSCDELSPLPSLSILSSGKTRIKGEKKQPHL